MIPTLRTWRFPAPTPAAMRVTTGASPTLAPPHPDASVPPHPPAARPPASLPSVRHLEAQSLRSKASATEAATFHFLFHFPAQDRSRQPLLPPRRAHCKQAADSILPPSRIPPRRARAQRRLVRKYNKGKKLSTWQNAPSHSHHFLCSFCARSYRASSSAGVPKTIEDISLPAGAYTRPLFSSTLAVSHTPKHPAHPTHPLTPS
jgi:hypothetical protein